MKLEIKRINLKGVSGIELLRHAADIMLRADTLAQYHGSFETTEDEARYIYTVFVGAAHAIRDYVIKWGAMMESEGIECTVIALPFDGEGEAILPPENN